MSKITWYSVGLALLVSLGGALPGSWLCRHSPCAVAAATGWRKADNGLEVANQQIQGRLLDYSFNHGTDNRVWSRSLQQRRDLYVYLPPHYDPGQKYPLMILLHGFALDEQMIFELIPHLDDAMVKGKLPPFIVAAPDGSLVGEPCLLTPGSFFLNSHAGDYEDFVLHDVWDFMTHRFPIRPERGAHVLAGVSMGGFASFSLGIRHREGFGVLVAINAPLNLRWVDKEGHYFTNFDPHNWGWRQEFRPHDPIGRFYGGLLTLRVKNMMGSLFGKGDEVVQEISKFNPIELVDRTHLRDGEVAMFAGYGGRDEFNLDAQVESFLYLCKFRRLTVGVAFLPEGKHDTPSAIALLPATFNWLAPLMAPFSPGFPYRIAGPATPPPAPVLPPPPPPAPPVRRQEAALRGQSLWSGPFVKPPQSARVP